MGKNIVICYDGTGNEYGSHNTNVVKFFRYIKCDDRTQMAFYDPGVGTFNPFNPGTIRRSGRWIGRLLGGALGWGLEKNIRDGYRYLMNYYEDGDSLYLFGFSRGAFTARALSGMLHYFGLLEKGSENLLPYVSKNYVNKEFDRAKGFKRTFCRPCIPHFIGVWDTVKSLDYFGRKKFYDSELKGKTTHGYQAVSIDEKRSKFEVSLWNEHMKQPNQAIEQVWFPGVHSDVGGGYPESGLSSISLGWMMDKARASGLTLKNGWRDELDQNPRGVLHTSYSGGWKLLGTAKRRIPTNSLIHQSVLDRMFEIKSYKPGLPETYQPVNNPTYRRATSTGFS